MKLTRRTDTSSPFQLRRSDNERLAKQEGFVLLRQYLSEHCPQRSCDAHQHTTQTSPCWTLSRDIIHGLLVPIVELFNEAVSVAEQTTHVANAEDLEYAFRGNARFAFVWLQSFLERERKWCLTQGCAACVVEHALDSEFSIRLLFAACKLSDIDPHIDSATLSLPSFGFFSQYLVDALQADDLWSGCYIEQVQLKAEQLRDGLEELMHQNASLRSVLYASSSSSDDDDYDFALSVKMSLAARRELPRTKLKRGKVAKRQRALEVEETWWTEQSYLQAEQRIAAQARSVPIAS